MAANNAANELPTQLGIMLLPKLLLLLTTSASLASAAPNAKRQNEEYGRCRNYCRAAMDLIVPFCHAKPVEECRKACDVNTYLTPLNDCGACLAEDDSANDDARALIRGWMDSMVETCRTPEKTMYGGCGSCQSAVDNLAPYCHGKSREECRKACTVSPPPFLSAQS